MKNPRVQELLREIGEAQRLLEQLGPRVELNEAHDSLLRDLGRAVVQFARLHAAHTLLPVDDGSAMVTHDLYTDEVPGEDDTDWYTSERRSAGPLFDPGDIEDGTTDVPEPDAKPDVDDSVDEPASDEVTLDALEAFADDPGSPFVELHADPAPTWAHHTHELLQLLRLPRRFDDPGELAVEASKVQWAVGELDTRLTGMPYEVQLAFVGMLAARAQHLREQLDVDVGPRLALDRLARYRFAADLPPVVGLSGMAVPESGSWEADTRRWWALFAPRLA
jgi:hypothetical protein